MSLELVQVDAFSRQLFGGNPAAVIVVDDWPDNGLMQNIAMENQLSETVFVKQEDAGWGIRWFTPDIEVDLCGHATLAAAYVLFQDARVSGDMIHFTSQSGPLSVQREADRLYLDFPSRPGTPLKALEGFANAIGQEVLAGFQSRDTLLILESQEQVEDCKPDMRALSLLDTFAVIISAPGRDCDFVSRFFAPGAGIDEDPVTGSAHCTLTPYWAERLNRTSLRARQLSRRGGELFCEYLGERVRIGGYCKEYMRGRIALPD
ncbi:MAG: PhzF family phenazine biosynthesis protein [Ketobacteraceae bacterium]|nr:PhzF family phenazine biosynthesis protein [Ketobacteraceae bacterium]